MSTWKSDGAHSRLGVKVKHLMVSTVYGEFKSFEVTLSSKNDDFDDSSVSFVADANSIFTNNDARDGHLKSADFLDTEKFKTIEFVSTAFKKIDDSKYEIKGDLHLRGVKKEITFTANLTGKGNAMDKSELVAFEIEGVINRMDFGVSWNSAIETGGVVVSENVWFNGAFELKKTD